jgi:hypothetical protein
MPFVNIRRSQNLKNCLSLPGFLFSPPPLPPAHRGLPFVPGRRKNSKNSSKKEIPAGLSVGGGVSENQNSHLAAM